MKLIVSKFGVISFLLSFLLVSVLVSLWFNSIGWIDRSYVELFSIIAVLLTLYLTSTLLSFFITVSVIIVYMSLKVILLDGLFIAAYDVAAIPLLVYWQRIGISKDNMFFLIWLFVSMSLAVGVYDYLNSDFVDGGGRINSFFKGSMHYAFFTTGMAFCLYFTEMKFKSLLFFMLIISSFLSGARAPMLVTLVLAGMFFYQNYSKKISMAMLFTLLILFLLQGGDSEIRSLSYVEGSDAQRLNSYYEWVERQDVNSIFLGIGRFYLGSVGVSATGSAVVIESSILTYLEAYGVFLTIVLVYPVYRKFLRIQPQRMNSFLVFGLFMLVSMLSPFWETPSILFVNSLLISSALINRKI